MFVIETFNPQFSLLYLIINPKRAIANDSQQNTGKKKRVVSSFNLFKTAR